MVHLTPHVEDDIDATGTGFNMDDKVPPQRKLTPEAKRALAEAEARRAKTLAHDQAKESGGPSGPEPTRYGDWERKGIASDF
jgi:hypothetical protein